MVKTVLLILWFDYNELTIILLKKKSFESIGLIKYVSKRQNAVKKNSNKIKKSGMKLSASLTQLTKQKVSKASEI